MWTYSKCLSFYPVQPLIGADDLVLSRRLPNSILWKALFPSCSKKCFPPESTWCKQFVQFGERSLSAALCSSPFKDESTRPCSLNGIWVFQTGFAALGVTVQGFAVLSTLHVSEIIEGSTPSVTEVCVFSWDDKLLPHTWSYNGDC